MNCDLFEHSRAAASYTAGEMPCWQSQQRVIIITANISYVTIFRQSRRHEAFYQIHRNIARLAHHSRLLLFLFSFWLIFIMIIIYTQSLGSVIPHIRICKRIRETHLN